jgi:hypothetical protein
VQTSQERRGKGVGGNHWHAKKSDGAAALGGRVSTVFGQSRERLSGGWCTMVVVQQGLVCNA